MALTLLSAPLGGPNSTVPVNSHGAKIKPATVKWLRPGYGVNAVSVLSGTVICSQWGNGRELLIPLTGSQMKITGPITAGAVISGFYAAARQGFGVFFYFFLLLLSLMGAR